MLGSIKKHTDKGLEVVEKTIVNYQKFTIKLKKVNDNEFVSDIKKNDFYNKYNVRTYCCGKLTDISTLNPYDISYEPRQDFVLIGGFKLKGGGICNSKTKVAVTEPERIKDNKVPRKN